MTPTQTDTQKPKRGRPKKHVDLELVEKLAHIQCTHSEIASALGVSVDTLSRDRSFAEVYTRGAQSGRKSLRRMQFESANKGNIAMQIWLGKQYLGQSDYVTKEIHETPPSRKWSVREMRQMRDYARKHPERASQAVIEAGCTAVEFYEALGLPAPATTTRDADS